MPLMRLAWLVAFAWLSGCETPPGWVGTIRDAATPDCTATRVPLNAVAVLSPGTLAFGESTFELWARVDGTVDAPYGRIAGVESTGACAGGTANWEVQVDPNGRVHGSFGSGYSASGTGATVAAGAWFHVVMEYVGGGVAALYVNGAQVETYTRVSGALGPASGCEIRLGAADDGVSHRVPLSVAAIRFRQFTQYTASFTPEVEFTRDADTRYLFDPSLTDAFPLVDGPTSFQVVGGSSAASGPGCD